MKAGKYTVKDFFVNRYLQQVVIPEIQRDYVWQAEQLGGLLTSLLASFSRFVQPATNVVVADPELAASFAAFQRRRDCSASIGFVYAYSDAECAGRYFLIDGQQRLTSVFLMLLALAHRRPELRPRFRRIFYEHDHLKLAYHVRDTSHEFLLRLVPYLLPDAIAGSAEAVTDQVWYSAAAAADPTVRNLVTNFNFLLRHFSEEGFRATLSATTLAAGSGLDTSSPEAAFFDYLTDFTEFYYFDTNLSEQGEDLYIYLNARGEQLQPNENIKADLLGHKPVAEREAWGIKWEEWQDFFWQHRESGSQPRKNADAGFNGFLACLTGLTNLVRGHPPTDLKAASATRQLMAALELETIEQYVECLRFLVDKQGDFARSYTYASWLSPCLSTVWTLLNNEAPEGWLANYNDDNQSAARRRMAFIWPVLRFMHQHGDLATLAPDDVFRVVRQQYVRYHNHHDSKAALSQLATGRPSCSVFSLNITEDETAKHTVYHQHAADPEQVRRYEALIWEIEDHPLNLDGSGVGKTNVTHLLSLTPSTSLVELEKVRDKFYELFPKTKRSYETIQTLLLHYGPYQNRENPWGYFSFNFGNWKRTIRGLGSEENKGQSKSIFQQFFDDFINDTVRDAALPAAEAHELHQKILWYSQQPGSHIWQYGTFIGYSYDWSGRDAHFPDFPKLYNTRGDMRADYRELQCLIHTTSTH